MANRSLLFFPDKLWFVLFKSCLIKAHFVCCMLNLKISQTHWKLEWMKSGSWHTILWVLICTLPWHFLSGRKYFMQIIKYWIFPCLSKMFLPLHSQLPEHVHTGTLVLHSHSMNWNETSNTHGVWSAWNQSTTQQKDSVRFLFEKQYFFFMSQVTLVWMDPQCSRVAD